MSDLFTGLCSNSWERYCTVYSYCTVWNVAPCTLYQKHCNRIVLIKPSLSRLDWMHRFTSDFVYILVSGPETRIIPLHGLQPWQAQSQRVQNSKSGWEYSKNRNVLRPGNAEKHDLKKHRCGIGALNKNWRNMMGVHCSFQTLKNHSTLLCRLFSSRCETFFIAAVV